MDGWIDGLIDDYAMPPLKQAMVSSLFAYLHG